MTKRPETQFPQIWVQKMCKVCLAFLVILILFSDSSEARRRPDCTPFNALIRRECRRSVGDLDCFKYVFHPDCRGVAAKRSESEEFVLDPRSSLNEAGADHFISTRTRTDDDFLEPDEDDFGDKMSLYDKVIAAKIWPIIQKALRMGSESRVMGSDALANSPQKRTSDEAKLEKWSKVMRHLLEQQEK